MKTKSFLKVGALLAFVFAFASCTQEDVMNNPLDGNEGEGVVTRSVNDVFVAEEVEFYGNIDYYVDAPGNIYGMYSKGYVDLMGLDNRFSEITQALPSAGGQSNYSYYFAPSDMKPTYGFCVDNVENIYAITSNNKLVKMPKIGNDYGIYDLTPRFPANTVFLSVVSAQVNGNVFVTTAQGDGSSNHWRSYNEQSIYRVAANGTATKVISNIQSSVVPKPGYEYSYSDGRSHTQKYFTYPNILSKAKGAFVYGMASDGSTYFKAGTMNGKVTYFTPKVPIQHLTAGTNVANPIALSGRQVLELLPNARPDIVIGRLPDSIQGEPVLFLTNADATIFYLVMMENRKSWNDEMELTTILYRLRLNN